VHWRAETLLTPAQRDATVELVEKVVRLPESQTWGKELGPHAIFTRTVLATVPGADHEFSTDHDRVVIKVSKGSADDTIAFQQRIIEEPPAAWGECRFQQTLRAGHLDDGSAYKVLDYVPGATLEPYLANRETPLSAEVASSILRQLFGDVLIPWWDAGFRFADFRQANWIYEESTDTLTMIDTDGLRPGMEGALRGDQEVLQSLESIAVSRFPGLILAVMTARTPSLTKSVAGSRVKNALEKSKFIERMTALGTPKGSRVKVEQSLKKLLLWLRL